MNSLKKLLFCLRVSHTPGTLFKLLVNTKIKTARTLPYSLILDGRKLRIFLRGRGGDIPVFYDVFWRNIYQIPELNDARVIVDLGAHTGMASLFFTLHSRASVYAVEPDPDNFRILSLNKTNNMTIVNAAISDLPQSFLKKAPLNYNSRITSENTGLEVEGITMSKLLSRLHINHIDILKVDIEGAEKMLFTSDTDWLDHTDSVIIELHDPVAENLFCRTMHEKGFQVEKKNLANENIFYAYKNKRARVAD